MSEYKEKQKRESSGEVEFISGQQTLPRPVPPPPPSTSSAVVKENKSAAISGKPPVTFSNKPKSIKK